MADGRHFIPNMLSHNLRGLALDNSKKSRISSSDAKWSIIHSLTNSIDLVMLTETKTVLKTTQWANFFPLGRKFKPLTYSCTGLSDGIIIFGNTDSITNHTIDILQEGRAVLVQFKKNNYNYAIYTLYLSSSNYFNRMHTLHLVNDSISYIKRSHTQPKIILTGDFNIDLQKNPTRQDSKVISSILSSQNLTDLFLHNGFVTPTRIGDGLRANHQNTIDYFFISNELLDQYKNVFHTVTPFSDHVILNAHSSNPYKPPQPPTPHSFLFKHPLFRSEASNTLYAHHQTFLEEHQDFFHQTSTNSPLPDITIYLDWLEFISNHLDALNINFFNSHCTQPKQKQKSFQKQAKSIIKKVQKSETIENLTELQNLKNNYSDYVSQEARSRRANQQAKRATIYAKKSHPFAFLSFKNKSERKIRAIYDPSDQKELITDQSHIPQVFANFHSQKTAWKPNNHLYSDPNQTLNLTQHTPHNLPPNVDDILQQLGTSLDEIMPPLTTPHIDFFITTNEIKEALNSMQNGSCPGLSGRDKSYYAFLFDLFPNFFQGALNALISFPNLENSQHSWLKQRKIVFIPKKAKDLKNPANYRPISLLEVFYKLASKILANKLAPYLPDIVDTFQFGFVKQRCISTAQSTIQLLARELGKKDEATAMIFLDIAAAFDSVLPSTNRCILEHIFPNSHVPRLLCQLVQGGRAHVEIAGYRSNPFDLEVGTGQGDPASSFVYLVQHSFWIRLSQFLIHKHLPQANLKITVERPNHPQGDLDVNLDPVIFADDTVKFLQLDSISQARIYLRILKIGELLTGLKVNNQKTEIIIINKHKASDSFIQTYSQIGEITDEASHLGLQVKPTPALSTQATWEATHEKFKKTVTKFQSSTTGADLLHRRQLLQAVVGGAINHIFRVHAFPPDQVKKLDTLFIKALWRKNNPDGSQYGRIKIASKRIAQPYESGGLALPLIEHKSFLSFLNSFFTNIKYIKSHPTSFLAKALNFNPIMFYTNGSRNLDYTKNLMEKMFPSVTQEYLSKYQQFITKLEKHEDYYHIMPIVGNSYSTPSLAIKFEDILPNPDDIFDTSHPDLSPNHPWHLLCITTLTKHPTPTRRNRKTNYPLQFNEEWLSTKSSTTRSRLKHFLRKIRRDHNFYTKLRSHPTQNFLGYATSNPSYVTLAYKKIFLRCFTTPPSYHTRIRDKLDIPSESEFKSAYSAVKTTKQLDSLSKTHIIEVLNRTIRTPKLLKLTKIQDDDTCPRCPVIADSTHIATECDAAYMSNKTLLAFLNTHYPNSGITPTNFQFFIPSKKLGSRFNSQFLHLLASLSKLAFSIPFEPPDRVMYWSNTVFYAKILSTINATLALRKSCKWSFNMIEKFLSFFIECFDTIDDYAVNGSISHFRISAISA